MEQVFNKILLPVDFSVNTDMAIKKALELAEPAKSTIHLFHVIRPLSAFNLAPVEVHFMMNTQPQMVSNLKIEGKLRECTAMIEEALPGIGIETELCTGGSIEENIIRKAEKEKPDLIILGKHSRHSWLSFLNTVSPNRIALNTGCPVLTIKPGSLYSRIKTVVVPVGSFVPYRKLDLIAALNQRFRIKVALVTIMGRNTEKEQFSPQVLVETYRMLRDSVHCPVEYEVLHSDNRAKATLDYAQSIMADIILVTPDAETRLSSFSDRHISDVLAADSKLQVLAVGPKPKTN